MDIQDLIERAIEAMSYAYTPYSNFKVGAALLTKSGKIFTGCNIENAAFSPTVCAERTAIFKAVSEGETEFEAIAVVGGPNGELKETGDFTGPCGVCRQVLMEFGSDIKIISANSVNEYFINTVADLTPKAFGPANLTE
ncbi:cytidine deaminase [Gottschalkiaceae bacterium SANA]|nr:cytidine deaminase [Gottschalkiaceae bacterium SANA]